MEWRSHLWKYWLDFYLWLLCNHCRPWIYVITMTPRICGRSWSLHILGGVTNAIPRTHFTVPLSFRGPHQLLSFSVSFRPSLLARTWVKRFLRQPLLCVTSAAPCASEQTVCDPAHLPVHQQGHLHICKSGHRAKSCSPFASYITAVGLLFGTRTLICACNDLGEALEGKELWLCSTC